MTTIEWTHVPGYAGDVWNPTTGCNKVSPGCKHCYAEQMHKRLARIGVKGYERPFLEGAVPQPDRLAKPMRRKKPTCYFVNSMSDLFHKDVPFSFIDQVFAVMALCPQHIFIILTKRPERMAEYFSTRDSFAAVPPTPLQQFGSDFVAVGEAATVHQHPLSNVWLGTSVENQDTANARIPHLLNCPAAVCFLSCEPLLGPVDLVPWALPPRTLPQRIHWVIAGGESGPNARPMHPEWTRSLRDQCADAGVPFFFKQWGRWAPLNKPWTDGAPQTCRPSETWPRMVLIGKAHSGNILDGQTHSSFPCHP